jgi:hypothetical protein
LIPIASMSKCSSLLFPILYFQQCLFSYHAANIVAFSSVMVLFPVFAFPDFCQLTFYLILSNHLCLHTYISALCFYYILAVDSLIFKLMVKELIAIFICNVVLAYILYQHIISSPFF